MLDKKDVQWWVQEAQKHPEQAADIIRTLAERLSFLDKQNEELRAEVIALRRKQMATSASAELTALQQRIAELEAALSGTGVDRRVIVYTPDRIEANAPLDSLHATGIGRPQRAGVNLLVTRPGANLVVITADSRAFAMTAGALPIPKDAAAPFGNPDNVAAIVDAAAFETCRFLTLLTQRGFVYSVLVGVVTQAARRGELLLRNLIPDDPITAALPSTNADILAVSQKGRWTRFPEKSIAGVGSPTMELPKGDALAAVLPLSGDPVLTLITTDGRLFVRPSSGLVSRRAPGAVSGVLLKGVDVVGLTAAQQAVVLTSAGKLVLIDADDLPYRAQTDTGVPLPGIDASDTVLAIAGV